MRFFLCCFLLFAGCIPLQGQGPPPEEPRHFVQSQGAPPLPADASTLDRMKLLIKKQVNKAIDGKSYPNIENWRPLSAREKFDRFLNRTHASRTFAAAGVDALKDSITDHNHEYERSFMGLGQRYGVTLGVGETEVFFEQFLVPALLKQDPRYFRNPSLPFMKRAWYSLSRVLITRADDGHSTFNASRIVGGAASQSLADLYVPGYNQGLHPILDRVSFDLARDAGLNLVHEFWPDLRRKFLHR